MAERSKKKKYLLPILIVAVAVAVAILLVVLRREPPRAETQQQAPLVETVQADPGMHQMVVSAFGTVAPAREVRVVPQVAGQIEWVNPDFVPGGIVRENELLFVIDSSDYVVALQEAQSALQEAQARLEQEQGQQEVARREWELFADQIDSAEANRDLALRGPQLQSARAGVSAAQARLNRARLNVRRTRLRAPFNGFVRNENADVGQLVSAQSQVGTIVGIDKYWVRVSIPEERIPYIAIPGVNADTGSLARIRHVVGGREIIRQGRVEKLLGDVDPAGRMARLLVSIDDPMGIRDVADTAERFLPLLIEAYVEVFIEGPRRDSIFAIPRSALHDGDRVYLLGSDSTLQIVRPDIAWRSEDSVFIAAGLEPGDRIITSTLSSVVEGMRLRLNDEQQPRPDTTDNRTGLAGPRRRHGGGAKRRLSEARPRAFPDTRAVDGKGSIT